MTTLAGPEPGLHNPSAVAVAEEAVYLTNAAFDGPDPPPSLMLIHLSPTPDPRQDDR